MATQFFGWDLPVPGGDVGAWGSKLNVVLTEADTDLNAVNVTATAAQNTANSALSSAQSATALATSAQSAIAAKILVYTRTPTASDSASDGTLWCVV